MAQDRPTRRGILTPTLDNSPAALKGYGSSYAQRVVERAFFGDPIDEPLAAPATAIDVIQLAPLVEEYPVPTTTTSFPADLTAGKVVTSGGEFEYLMAGGGGAGGHSQAGSVGGGGGGAGGLRKYVAGEANNTEAGPLTIAPQTLTITVGAGGVARTADNDPTNDGENSSIAGPSLGTIEAEGGGGGGWREFGAAADGRPGGSGGGGAGRTADPQPASGAASPAG